MIREIAILVTATVPAIAYAAIGNTAKSERSATAHPSARPAEQHSQLAVIREPVVRPVTGERSAAPDNCMFVTEQRVYDPARKYAGACCIYVSNGKTVVGTVHATVDPRWGFCLET